MEKIEIQKCTGYVWLSDQSSPKVYKNEPLSLELNECVNPFVIEANLTDGQVSHSIRYVDGKYYHKQFVLDELSEEYSEVNTYAQSMSSVSGLLFRRYWREQKDVLCEGWNVLKPAELVFIGFSEKEEPKC